MRLIPASVTMLVIGSAQTLALAAPPRIVEKVVPGGYEISIRNFTGGDQNEAQALIAPNVQRLCGQLTPRWGRFLLEAMVVAPNGEQLKPGRFKQEITCVARAAETVPAPAGPFTPTPTDESAVSVAALKFLDLRDRGQSDASFAMLSPGMRETTDQAAWEQDIRSKPSKTGGAVERRIAKVSWYVDPPGVAPGVYAAADFDGKSELAAIHCGYVALKRQASGDFLVVRIEEGYLANAQAKEMDAPRMAEMRTALQCRN